MQINLRDPRDIVALFIILCLVLGVVCECSDTKVTRIVNEYFFGGKSFERVEEFFKKAAYHVREIISVSPGREIDNKAPMSQNEGSENDSTTEGPSEWNIKLSSHNNMIGRSFAEGGAYEEAVNFFTSAIEENPGNIEAYYNRGSAYMELERYEEAIDDFDMVIKLDRERVDAYTARGIAYKNMGRYNEAVEDFGKAIELDPDNSEAYFNRGLMYRDMGDVEKAKVDLAAACEKGEEEACTILGEL
ncbi:MAG: tetratricopeptide repeat protein [Deltaproteobacteria bacterium]|nr:tetratricopeptide repeat protein [Candidatus Zymogenaceae bacterium]